MNHCQRIASAITAVITTGALTVGLAPAASADTPSVSERTATVVEKATGAVDLAAKPGVGQDVPSHAGSDVTTLSATGKAVSIGLPETKNVAGTKAGSGTTVYPGAAPSTDLAVQPTADGGIRALAVLKDATAPREQRYDIDLPDGSRLVKLNNGAVAALGADGAVVGGFDAPWAKDTNGRPVPTQYRIEGDTLIQTVETTPTTAFPVVADPWWNPTTWKSWKKVRCIAKTSQGAAVAGGFGGAFTGPGIAAGAGVGAVGGALGGIWSC
ncbi:hypothetical protein [Streptomyces huasconensis]|uniref:hypothetical protein n=1 Tax=Streptomyces huasconensis TaxID=1854574 RepID=UPI0036F727C8